MTQIGINDLTVFIPETQAVATEVSANFSVVKAAHNDTDTRVGTLEATITKSADKTASNIFDKTQSYKKSTITGATNATPIVITSAGHGRSTGDSVFIEDVGGNTAANGIYTITKVTNDTFSLDGSIGNGVYTSGGVAYLLPKNKEDLVNKIYLDNNAGGVNKFSALGTVSTNITLEENKITTAYFSGTNTITLPTVTDTAKQVTCILDFTTAGTGQPTITNTNIKWIDTNGGHSPNVYSTLSGVRNVISAKSIWISASLYWEIEYRTYGGILTSFTRPNLSANGTLGGASFAVSATNAASGFEAYKAVDGSTSTLWETYTTLPQSYIFYNPDALRVDSLSFRNAADGGVATAYSLYGSNDNVTYTLIGNYTNAVTANSATWNTTISSTGFYKYHKQTISTSSAAYIQNNELGITANYIAV